MVRGWIPIEADKLLKKIQHEQQLNSKSKAFTVMAQYAEIGRNIMRNPPQIMLPQMKFKEKERKRR